jgi:predicted secreted Zn-dependent protease
MQAMKSPARAGETGQGLHIRLKPAGRRGGPDIGVTRPYSITVYSITWMMRRVRGSTSTVWPFTTV